MEKINIKMVLNKHRPNLLMNPNKFSPSSLSEICLSGGEALWMSCVLNRTFLSFPSAKTIPPVSIHKKYLPFFRTLLLPFGDPGFKGQVTAFADATGGFFTISKKRS